MKISNPDELKSQLEWHGRILKDGNLPGIYFDWTVCSFTLRFRGTRVIASLHAVPGKYQVFRPSDVPMQMQSEDIVEWPWFGVFIDGSETAAFTFDIRQTDQDYILFSSSTEEEHIIRVVKLSEALYSSAALTGLEIDGDLLPCRENNRKQIEFVGDSITCGFGNVSATITQPFFNNEENGWLSYGPVAARKLGMEPVCISVSGIATAANDVVPYGMLDLYEYTDKLRQQEEGEDRAVWDFSSHPSDYVVINLGTNDQNSVAFSKGKYTTSSFEEDYLKLLSMVRRCNPEAIIICTLGSINYYLFDNILAAVARYKESSKDQGITTFKFSPMSNREPDAVSCGHPSYLRDEIMGEELAELIRGMGKDIQ